MKFLKQKFRQVKARIKQRVAEYRKGRLINKDFSIISDNCWSSFIYQHFNLPYRSPFAGLFLFSPDYLKLLNDLERHLSCELHFIDANDSRYKDELIINKTFGKYPIGVINGIEIHFLHYTSEQEARDKWNKRVKRINFNNLIVKFCDRDLATPELIEQFLALPYKNKIFLTSQNYQHSQALKLKNEDGAYVMREWRNFRKTINPTKLINGFYGLG